MQTLFRLYRSDNKIAIINITKWIMNALTNVKRENGAKHSICTLTIYVEK